MGQPFQPAADRTDDSSRPLLPYPPPRYLRVDQEFKYSIPSDISNFQIQHKWSDIEFDWVGPSNLPPTGPMTPPDPYRPTPLHSTSGLTRNSNTVFPQTFPTFPFIKDEVLSTTPLVGCIGNGCSLAAGADGQVGPRSQLTRTH